MLTKHRTPTLVSMWMLDVFCCALGCVTLLWLLNNRQAGDALHDLEQARRDITATFTELDATKLRLNSEIKQLTTQLGAVQTEKDQLARKLGIAQDEAKAANALLDSTKVALNANQAKLDAANKELALVKEKAAAGAKELALVKEKADAAAKELALTQKKVTEAEDLLKKKQADADALAKKATDTAASADELAKLVRKKGEELAAMAKKAEGLQKLLADVEGRLASAKKDADTNAAAAKTAAKTAADELAAMKATSAKSAEEAAAARGMAKEFQKKLDDANATIIDLQGEKKKLADKLDTISRDTENKFAGIAMTGERVVFVVDMSGSMDRVDERTVAPQKWPTVCETVAKVMRSIPTLKAYQVVVFSTSAKWLFGNGEWRPFEGEKSAKEVQAALLKVRPEGDTNMYQAFETAFALRASGLDTLYLFSDGLPTVGPGLTPDQERTLKPAERTEAMSNYVRSRMTTGWNRPLDGKRVRLHSIGFFFESPEVGAFLWALSRENDGSFVGMSKP